MQPTATTFLPVSEAASSVSTESFLADSTKPQVLTTTTSESSGSAASSQPPAAPRPPAPQPARQLLRVDLVAGAAQGQQGDASGGGRVSGRRRHDVQGS